MRDPGNLDETVSGVRDGDLVDLLARVESASGADRELSVRVWFEMHPDREGLWALSGLDAQRSAHSDETLLRDVLGSPALYGFFDDEDHFTASLDASLGLVERVLPGWWWDLDCRGCAHLGPVFTPLSSPNLSWGKTPALALLAALLRALIAQAADTSARNVPAREGSANASHAGTRDQSLAPTNAEPSGKED